ncbi:deoxyribodipyrimidine photo-lyase [Sphingomonas kaistensis]|uniref:Deoxyribodipyrimidine photo-lyase n=1 Tax=Sphingomonas kaistensis TaxID=298708 RepID=A0A7X6BFY8_9SPHN|nr:deoxyribodipyrimidine photo-lyase [Sphingomonas kaistensis]NJC05904.1 deoxyribodipyrimidine photo-lyase [Sphingomonas kaistensis]
MDSPQLVWFRQDLRTADHPALIAAAEKGPTVGLYVLDDETPGKWKLGGASRWWLHHSLAALSEELEKLGSTLILRRGRSSRVVPAVAKELGASGIHATRHYEPWWREAECEHGDFAILHHGDVLHEPGAIRSGAGHPFKIYGPYYRALESHMPPPEPVPAPKLTRPSKLPNSDKLEEFDLLPTKPDWAQGFADWTPGSKGAARQLRRFVDHASDYGAHRDHPAEDATSRLSPHLHHGELSPRQLWHALGRKGGEKFRRELAWRDFSRNVALADRQVGDTAQRPLGLRTRHGKAADADFKAWTRGRTGYPLVDAGMRQLWFEGWMHNRARLVTASFLVKHLLIDWWRGAEWFWDTLVDADYANNSQNWQWIAGTGFDSQPFYRIIAPLTQSEKFDAADYIRRWVPELARLSDADIHDPWGRGVAPADYPEPLIDHREARERALEAFRKRTS